MSVNYTYDDAMRLATVQRSGETSASAYGYDTGGRRTSLALPNGVSTSYIYTANDQLDVLTTTKPGWPSTLGSFDYSLDATGNRTGIAYADGTSSVYAFDNAYRLTRDARYDSQQNLVYDLNYEYDAVGNRTKMAALRAAQYRADTNTLALWRMEEPADGNGVFTISDSSGNGNSIEGSSNLTQTEGRYGKALDFFGGFLVGSDSATLELGTNDFTIEAWVRLDMVPVTPPYSYSIIQKWDDPNDHRSYKLYLDSGVPTILLSPDGVAVYTLSGTSTIAMGEWTHIAAIRSGSAVELCVNGAQVAVGTYASPVFDGTADVLVGDFGGPMDEVRISNVDRWDSGELNLVTVDYVFYNERNQLVTETSGTSVKTYSYDRNGNNIGWTETATVGGNPVVVAESTMVYDALNRMTSVSGPSGTEQFTYFGAEWHRRSSGDTHFLYDGDNVVADLVSDGQGGYTVTRTYVTPFLDQNLSMSVGTGYQAGIYYYTQDGLGSVRALTNASGNVMNLYDYTAFGEPNPVMSPSGYGTSESIPQRYTYTGREKHDRTHLMYYRYRMYEPRTGRFTARDPLRPTGAFNYVAISNLPSQLVDPYGLLERSALVAVSWSVQNLPPGRQGLASPEQRSHVISATCGTRKGGCAGPCQQSYRKSVTLVVLVRLSISASAGQRTGTAARHEYHHAMQIQHDVQRALNSIDDKEYSCVPLDQIKAQEATCVSELTDEAKSAFQQGFSAWNSSFNPPGGYSQFTDPYEFSGGPYGDHPLGGAWDHMHDPWPSGGLPEPVFR